MSSTIRSATVRLEADVASYIAKMQAAGRATDDAFRKSSIGATQATRDTKDLQTGIQRLSSETESLDRGMSRTSRTSDGFARSVSRFTMETRSASGAQTTLTADVERTERALKRGERGLDSYTGRLGVMITAIGSVAPALAPLGAQAGVGLASLANDAGMAALAAGSLVVAFHGVGKTLSAVNKAALDPTSANLEAAQRAMDQLSPAARQFVTELQTMRPLLGQIQKSAASGWFPGLTEALHNLTPLLPTIERIFHTVGVTGGNLLAQGAASLAGPEWHDFFDFINRQAPRAMTALGHVIGSLTHGLASLWMAFEPLSNGFNNWLVDVARSFDSWATGLSQTQGFREFLDYVHQTGPQVARAVGALANGIVQIVEAAAPLGGPVLHAITELAKTVGVIADSPLGTPIMAAVTAMSALNLATKATSATIKALGLNAVIAGREVAAAEREAAAAGSKFSYGQAAAAAYVGGTLANSGFDALGNALRPGQNSLGTNNNINAIVDSIRNGNKSKFTNPLSLIGFNPDHLGDKSVYQNADLGLSQMVTSGNGQEAAAIFAQIKAQVSDAAKYFPQYAAALKQADAATGQVTTSIQGLSGSMTGLRQITLSSFDAETNWRQALVNAEQQAKKNSAGIAGNSAAALANRAALSQLAAAWDGQSDAVRNNVDRQKQAYEAFLRTAIGMGVPIRKARDLADALINIPDTTKVQVVLEDRASTGIQGVFRQLNALNGKTANVWVRYFTSGFSHKPDPNSPSAHGMHTDPSTGQLVPNGSADGSRVPTDGGPYADRFHYMLAPGEFIVSNRHGQVDRNIDTLRSINRGYADGGQVGTHVSKGSDTAWITGGPWVSQHQIAVWGDLNVKVATLRDNMKDASKAYDKEKQARSALIDKMNQVSTDVQTGLRSDLFGRVDPWQSQYGSTSPTGVMGILTGDIGHGNQEIAAIKELRDKGVTGAALAAILSQGGLAGAQAFAKLSKTELAHYVSLYNRREKVLHSAGELAGRAAYGDRVDEMTHQLHELKRAVNRVEAAVKHADDHNQHGHKDTKDSIKGATANAGRRSGVKPRR